MYLERSLQKVDYIEPLLALLLIMVEGLLLIRLWVLLGRVLACLIGLAAVYSNTLSNSHSHGYCPGLHSREWRCWCHSLAINEISIRSIVSSAAYIPSSVDLIVAPPPYHPRDTIKQVAFCLTCGIMLFWWSMRWLSTQNNSERV
jgi:hypothetical protein